MFGGETTAGYWRRYRDGSSGQIMINRFKIAVGEVQADGGRWSGAVHENAEHRAAQYGAAARRGNGPTRVNPLSTQVKA